MEDRIPEPSAEAMSLSARLQERIREDIASRDGWIPFSRFMEFALHAPGLGYYSAGMRKVGRDPRDGSDFATAPELGSLFARALAVSVAALIRDGARSVTEFGAGSGALAADLLAALDAAGALPERYSIVEISADFRARQRERVAALEPRLRDRVHWLDALPGPVDGVVLGNEVLDAFPVRIVVKGTAGWLERGVVEQAGALAFAERAAAPDLVEAIERAVPDGGALPDGYVTERHEASDAWVATLVERLDDDAVALLFDYGFPASEYFHPQRASGTLVAHRRHRMTGDVLALPGLQDVTAHVDFTAVARAARDAGGLVAGYTSLQSFLVDCGIDRLVDPRSMSASAWARTARELGLLVSEAEMGELFKVIALARRARTVVGFGLRDRRAALDGHA